MESALGKEIIEKLWFGYGVNILYKIDQENTSAMFHGFFRNYFFYQFPWMFTTLMMADSFGIFSYW